MPFSVALPWGAPVSFGYLAGLNAAAVWLPFVLVAFAVMVGVARFWSQPRRFARYLAQGVGAVLIARYALVPLVHLFVQTARPFAELAFQPLIDPVQLPSFPSVHVSVLSAIAFVAGSARPAGGAALLLGAVIVGIARVFAGVHWPSDIVAGVIVGAVAAAIALNWGRLFARRGARA